MAFHMHRQSVVAQTVVLLGRGLAPAPLKSGKIEKFYPYTEMMTRYGKLKSLPGAQSYLKPGLSFMQPDALALHIPVPSTLQPAKKYVCIFIKGNLNGYLARLHHWASDFCQQEGSKNNEVKIIKH